MTGYTPQPTDIVTPGTTTALSEFFGFLGDCGQAATEVFSSIITGRAPDKTHLNNTVQDMIHKNLATASGVTTSSSLQTELASQGIATSIVDDWKNALSSLVGRSPVTLFLNNAQALPGEVVGVQGHFVTVVGYSPNVGKYIVSNPNSPSARNGQFDLYSSADLAGAGASQAIVSANPLSSAVGGLFNAPLGAVQTMFDNVIKDTGNSLASTIIHSLHIDTAVDLVFRSGLIVTGTVLLFVGMLILGLSYTRNRVQTAAPYVAAATSLA